MTETPSRRRRAVTLIAGAAVAGVLAGALAVYVIGSGGGNGNLTASADCAGALAAAKRVGPLAKGEVAAFRVASTEDSLAGLAFTDPEGKPVTLAGLGGKTTLLNFWATWCVPCRAEMPTLDKLEAEAGGKDFAVVAVNIDINGIERAKAFLDEIGVKHLPFYSDQTMGVFKELKGRGLALGLPTTVLVDGKGCRIGVLEGPAEWDSDDAKALIKAAVGA